MVYLIIPHRLHSELVDFGNFKQEIKVEANELRRKDAIIQ